MQHLKYLALAQQRASKHSDSHSVAASHLQNVIPALLVEDVVLEVFSVHVLGFLDLLRGDHFACGGGGGGKQRQQR